MASQGAARRFPERMHIDLQEMDVTSQVWANLAGKKASCQSSWLGI
jgi:hypothetical protein